jgi:ubiquitin C-terminal hydrolase
LPAIEANFRDIPKGANGLTRAFRQLQVGINWALPARSLYPLSFLPRLEDLKAMGGEDAGEMMRRLLRLLHEDLVVYNQTQAMAVASDLGDVMDGLPPAARSVVGDTFSIEMKYLNTCPKCSTGAHSPYSFMVLPLQMMERYSRESVVDLLALLTAYLSEPDPTVRTCPHCHVKLQHEGAAFSVLPPVLIIEINRTVASGTRPVRVNTPLSFPETLDMTGYASDSEAAITYQRKAVVQHYPYHYKAFILIDGSQYCFDDHKVTQSDPKNDGVVVLLMYERC